MFLYYGPTGAPVENQGEEWMKEIFCHKGEAYWKQGNGESSCPSVFSDFLRYPRQTL